MMRVLFVCTGNICRSPTAEAVMRRRLEEARIAHAVQVDSAGSRGFNRGAPPDRRAVAAAKARGYDLKGIVARAVMAADFHAATHILAMDRENLELLREICPPEHVGKLWLATDFSRRYRGHDVPDPYTESDAVFVTVLDMIEDLVTGLVEEIRRDVAA